MGRIPMGEGERLHAQRRRRFWSILGWLFVAGLITGAVAGVGLAPVLNGKEMPSWAAPLVAISTALAVLATIYGSWRFFTSVDEVEVVDNLWGSLIGFYAYVMIFPAWWVVWKVGLVGEPNDWAIFAAAFTIALAAYAYRKWQSR